MALRVSTACLAAVALLGSGNLPCAQGSKPADLPVRQIIVCQPLDAQQPTGGLLLGIGVGSDAELTGTFVLTPSEEPTEVEVLDVLPVEVVPAPQRSEVTCPYLQQQEARRQSPGVDASGLARGVLDTLQRLEEASKIYRLAEHLRRVGQCEGACRCYEEVHRHCPGSRYDLEALTHLRRLHAERAVEEAFAVGEEQEVVPAPKVRPESKGPVPDSKQKKPDASPQGDAPASPDGETVLRLAIPLVDPKVNRALHLLRRIGAESAGPGLIVVVEEPTANEEQEQKPRTHNPSATVQHELPNLLLEPAGGEWIFRLKKSSAEGDAPLGGTASSVDPNMTNLLRDWFEALPLGACLDLDFSRAEGWRVRCQLQVSGLAYRVVAEHSKPQGLIVYLLYP